MRTTLIIVLLTGAATSADVVVTQTAQRAAPGSVSCLSYDPAGLTLTSESGGTWTLERADGARIRPFANRADAEAGLAVFKEHTAICYIGRGNTFPDPYRSKYIMEFLRK
jgi:hypothetical protein